jgi:methylenetetrahydrofolate reductase (NADPH)
MKIKEIYKNPETVISFEIFPPKSKDPSEINKKIEELFEELHCLSVYNPAFISVTYGAGGSTRETTFDLVIKIQEVLKIQPMPHFTCVGSTRENIFEYIKKIEETGIENILALRGDPPKGEEKFQKPKDGFGFANELVCFIREHTKLGISVAGYPECHQECYSIDKDIDNLKRKIDCGADAVITQLFYDNEYFFNFVEKARLKGINVPIIPGILPVTGYNQIEKIVSMSNCKLPDEFKKQLEDNKDNAESIKQIGIEFAVSQCRELLHKGAPGIHFYTLNKSQAVISVLEELKK